MTITDSLLNFLKSEYTDERIRRSLLVNASREKIEKIDNSCKDEALFIYNLMSLSFSDKTNRYEPQIILIDGRRSFSVDDISDEQWSFMNSIQNEDISISIKARINDIFWTFRNEYPYAKLAIECYLNMYQLSFDTG